MQLIKKSQRNGGQKGAQRCPDSAQRLAAQKRPEIGNAAIKELKNPEGDRGTMTRWTLNGSHCQSHSDHHRRINGHHCATCLQLDGSSLLPQ